MDKAKEIIGRKLGPLPVWAYVVAGAAVIFLLRRVGGGSASSGSPIGSGGGGGVSPQTLDFQQSLLDIASSLRGSIPVTSNQPSLGPSSVIPTSDTGSLAPFPISSPTGGPVSEHTPISNTPTDTFTPITTILGSGPIPGTWTVIDPGTAIGAFPSGAVLEAIPGYGTFSLSSEALARGGVTNTPSGAPAQPA